MKKNNSLQRKLKFHCFQCQTLYQLMEIHSQNKPNCPESCRQKWQELCHEYYQEKVLGYIQQQEEQKEQDLEQSTNWPDWLKKPAK
ncbi:MAG: hypothetical protein mread185_000036 [Mycoplasmataceae bacterium]|nr:MAG: hypothetical protein mread185_000036 [Mycoplasmataceae bacterium]